MAESNLNTMDENKQITKVNDENLLITETKKVEQLIGKQTLLAQKEALQKQIKEIDEMLAYFN